MTTPSSPLPDDARCPCGSGEIFGACCAPLLRQERRAGTALALMRSRYTAFAVRDIDHLLRTWHPRTRPERAELIDGPRDIDGPGDVDSPGDVDGLGGVDGPGDEVRWLRLDVQGTVAGGPFDDAGTVEFTAHSKGPHGRHQQHELSRFVREDGSWFYLDGDV